MSPSARALFLIGALAILLALLAVAVPEELGYLGWTAGTIGALSVAAGFVTRALSSEPGENRQGGNRGPSGELGKLVSRPGTRLRARIAQRGQSSARRGEPPRNGAPSGEETPKSG
ncbi:hypothetical protein FHR84_002492 [Actinopolyspora biskrensis]|uniref:Uncharacterized protein n=1 Tax=Actinopolyspora biskrensis TaxID=1470178 RepID=A0A852YYC6_9ACTN|nr:hypothetical protein [Actinopolyspora biskrensis]NYH79158.1 hypothetical protein [Actinopolyspora biskrensis]